MSRISGNIPTPTAPEQPFGDASALNSVTIDDFLELMIAELQNQDPLNPLENDELLAQISQIREVGATDRLTETLDAVLLGQNVSSATALIGQEVTALSPDGDRLTGQVERVLISNGEPEISVTTLPSATLSDVDGSIEAGTYRYQVVYDNDLGETVAVELGPLTTTGTDGLDSAIEIFNLPEANGSRFIFRTDSTGEGDFHLIDIVSDVGQERFIDTRASAELAGPLLNAQPRLVSGGRTFTTTLGNVAEVRAPVR